MSRHPVASPGSGEDATPPIDEAWVHRSDLLLYARRILGAQRELAEDIVQEAFLRLHERAASGTPVREARPWLFRVTRNLALDERRRTRRGDAVRTSLEVVAIAAKGPHEVVQGREEARRALEGLGSLPPRERRVMILDQAGLTPRAIARSMQTTTNAVHQSLFRARRRLRDARAAAWGLLPLPLIRLLVRTASAPSLDRLPALTPGAGGRLGGGAGLAGLVAAAVIGTGVVADQPVIRHPSHTRADAHEWAPGQGAEPAGTGSAYVAGAAGPGSTSRSSGGGSASRTVSGHDREAPEREADPEPATVGSPPAGESDEGAEEREAPHEDSVTRAEDPGEHTSTEPRDQEASDAGAAEGTTTEGVATPEPEEPED
jgi:RNA polymerase sigma-70 factor (ECF subfamily)